MSPSARYGSLLDAQPERLYVTSGETLKKLSFGHAGLRADIYWMRAVQYYGGKRIDNSRDFHLLGSLIGIATTLDPRLNHAYRFGANFLSEREVGADQPLEAISLLNRGIKLSKHDSLVRLGLLKAVPLDPKGFPYVIDPLSGKVGLSPQSTVRRY